MILQANKIGRKAGNQCLLSDISLSIRDGDRLALVGPSGSGKTLLLRSLALLDPIDTGEVLWNGKEMRGNEIPIFRSQVIYLRQRPALLEGTVEKNLRLPFSLRVHREKLFDRQKAIALLNLLDQPESFLSKETRDLSGGEMQLTALLRVIQLDCRILLLDEPTAALDAKSTELVERLVAHWLDQKPSHRATVWVTHDPEQARRTSTSILRICGGRANGK